VSGDDDSLELKLAKLARDEAAADRKAAAADREAAEYERGQIEHAKRIIAQTEKLVALREQKLKELGEPEFLARERAAEAKLNEASKLMASYDAAKHAAALKLAGQDATPEIGAARDQEVEVNDEAIDAVMAIILYHDELIHRALPRQPGDGLRMSQLLGKLRAVKKGQRQAAASEAAA
jgi:hypothetical protein